jgi:hypothetical protein
MTYSLDDLHRTDPAKVLTFNGRPMQVNEIIQNICRGERPDELVQPTSTIRPEHSR